eukprot:gene3942-6100_t
MTRKAFLQAALEGDVPRLEELAAADGTLLTATSTSHRYTALHYAAERGHAAAVDRLVALGASPRTANAAGRTAADCAAARGHEGVRNLLARRTGGSSLARVSGDVFDAVGEFLDARSAAAARRAWRRFPREPLAFLASCARKFGAALVKLNHVFNTMWAPIPGDVPVDEYSLYILVVAGRAIQTGDVEKLASFYDYISDKAWEDCHLGDARAAAEGTAMLQMNTFPPFTCSMLVACARYFLGLAPRDMYAAIAKTLLAEAVRLNPTSALPFPVIAVHLPQLRRVKAPVAFLQPDVWVDEPSRSLDDYCEQRLAPGIWQAGAGRNFCDEPPEPGNGMLEDPVALWEVDLDEPSYYDDSDDS